MRILIVGRLFGLGGADQSLMPLARGLTQAGHALTLLLLRSPTHTAVFAEFPGRVMLPDNRRQAGQQLMQAIAQADLVIATSELTPTYLTWLVCRWQRKPLIADVQVCLSHWITANSHPLHHHLCRWVYPQIRWIRCVSEGVAQDLRQTYRVPDRQLQVISVPFDLDAIAQAAAQPLPAAQQALFQQRPTFVAIGRLTQQKRFDRAIQALHHLRGPLAIDANLIILGEGPLRPHLQQQVADLNLHDRVFLPGFVTNPYPHLRAAAGLLLSSEYEGFGRVIVDALIVGCPVVATDCPFGPAEILAQGQWGLLTPIADVPQMAAALQRVLTQRDLADRLRQQGQQRGQDFAAWPIARQYEQLVQQAYQAAAG